MTYIGGWNALVDRSQVAEGPKGEVTGRVAWLLWRSGKQIDRRQLARTQRNSRSGLIIAVKFAAYWSQSMSLRNKASLAFYWFLNWIFGRSITRF